MPDNDKIRLCKREGLKGCLYDAGGFGNFIGEVMRIEGDKYLFKRIYISYCSYEGVMYEDKEDHIWIIDGNQFTEKTIKVGDCVSFEGEVHLYKRRNGTYELGVKNPHRIKTVESYELPSDEDLDYQFIQQLTCECCKCRKQCYNYQYYDYEDYNYSKYNNNYGACINEEWAKGFQEYLKKASKNYDELYKCKQF